MTKTSLELKNIRFSYSANEPFIDSLSLSVKSGAITGLLGVNGAGKSTVLKIMAGLVRPLSGAALIDGRDVHSCSPKERARLVSYLPQTMDFDVPFTVDDLVKMGEQGNAAIGTGEALTLTGIAHKQHAFVNELSGGERRRAFLAMLLRQGSKTLLLDEPLANIDIKYQIEFLALLKKISHERGVSVVMALHDLNIAAAFDELFIFNNGKFEASGSPKETLTPKIIMQAFGVTVECLHNMIFVKTSPDT
ncbi:MAG: ABC transporter ATP-binding protein [Deltaproteobacteria bacterium]|nr:ABC transporter ATP-binding protein [Deltaproteobacteria bacterium]